VQRRLVLAGLAEGLSVNRKHAVLLGRAVSPLAMLAVGALVFQASHAAFSATTVNPSDSWSAGQINLSDDDSNTAMFTVTNAKPGDTGSKCIVVSSSAAQTYTTAVKIYASSIASATNSLDTNLTLKIDEGTGGTFANCAGFSAGATLYNSSLSGFTSTYTNFSNGLATSFAPTGGSLQSKVFKFTWTLNSGAANSVQGGTAGCAFTWEAQ
jgi:hypothetical protein